MASVWQTVFGAWAACALLFTPPAFAQPRAEGAFETPLRVDRFDVEEVPRLETGANLTFSVFGTPGASASVRIEGAAQALVLQEVQPGIYEGTYSIGLHDRIGARSRVSASLQRGSLVARALLEEPLQLGTDAAVVEATPHRPPSPSAAADDHTATSGVAAEAIDAREPEPIAVRGGPLEDPTPAPIAQSSRPDILPETGATVTAPPCPDCGVVESIRVVDSEVRPEHVGAVSGGLLGALIANHFADGPGRHLARIVGAIGGALAGHEIERRAARQVRYDVWLRMPDGALQVRSYPNRPPYQLGDRVRPATAVLAAVRRAGVPY